MYNEPLGLPKGSVRSIIALLVTTGFVASALIGDVSEPLLAVSATVIGYYFAKRQSDK